MFWDFKFTVKNQNLPKCRIVAEFFFETPIRAFFQGFQTNCTTRGICIAMSDGTLIMDCCQSSYVCFASFARVAMVTIKIARAGNTIV